VAFDGHPLIVLPQTEVDSDLVVPLRNLRLKGQVLFHEDGPQTLCNDTLDRPDVGHHELVHEHTVQLTDLGESIQLERQILDFLRAQIQLPLNLGTQDLIAGSLVPKGFDPQSMLAAYRVTLH
jgi:hypothetical protein